MKCAVIIWRSWVRIPNRLNLERGVVVRSTYVLSCTWTKKHLLISLMHIVQMQQTWLIETEKSEDHGGFCLFSNQRIRAHVIVLFSFHSKFSFSIQHFSSCKRCYMCVKVLLKCTSWPIVQRTFQKEMELTFTNMKGQRTNWLNYDLCKAFLTPQLHATSDA